MTQFSQMRSLFVRACSAVMLSCTGLWPDANWRRQERTWDSRLLSRARSSSAAPGCPVASAHAWRSAAVAVCRPFSNL
ncbi:hypothetical protein SUDANB38_02325 [Streptomyces sp. enrichment culture]